MNMLKFLFLSLWQLCDPVILHDSLAVLPPTPQDCHMKSEICCRREVYVIYISQLIWFARASSHVADFNTLNKLLTQKLLKQGYQNHKLHQTFF